MALDVTTAPRRITRPVRRVVDRPEPTQRIAVVFLLALTLGCSAALLAWPQQMSYAPFVPIVVAAGLFLRAIQMYIVFAAAATALLITATATGGEATSPTVLAALGVVMVLLVAVDKRRAQLGISPRAGADLLIDLRDRLAELGRTPQQLPAGWHAESSIQPAFGDAFSGDFLVSSASGEERLDLVLVDVSGKGTKAGSRSLMLSSGFAGLLEATAPAEFLPAANSYVLRQQWSEGFASAVHVSVDLSTGEYDVGSAGHPAAVHLHGGTGRWSPVQGTDGVLLGVVDSELTRFGRVQGRLERGDALLMYTDGVIESPDTDLAQGVDRMLGAADRAVAAGAGAADRICASALSGESDDRAVVLIWRD